MSAIVHLLCYKWRILFFWEINCLIRYNCITQYWYIVWRNWVQIKYQGEQNISRYTWFDRTYTFISDSFFLCQGSQNGHIFTTVHIFVVFFYPWARWGTAKPFRQLYSLIIWFPLIVFTKLSLTSPIVEL